MQQVNLYSEILKQQQQKSGNKLVIAAMALVAMVFVMFSGYLFWDINTTEAKLQQAQLQLNQEQGRVNLLLAKRPRQEPNKELIADVEQWQGNVNEAAQALEMLVGKEAILLKGFSSYLKAFAIESNPEVWLTAIHIDGQKQEVKLEGSTFDPQEIPKTLQQLQNKPGLIGLTFAKLVMEQSTKVAGQMDFSLSSSEQTLGVKADAQ
jgi:Tfp pilus assembly protein PilN